MSNCFLCYPERLRIYIADAVTQGQEQLLLQNLDTYFPPPSSFSFLELVGREIGEVRGQQGVERGSEMSRMGGVEPGRF